MNASWTAYCAVNRILERMRSAYCTPVTLLFTFNGVKLTAPDIFHTPPMHHYVAVRRHSIPLKFNSRTKKVIRKLSNPNLSCGQRRSFYIVYCIAERDTGKQRFEWQRKQKTWTHTHLMSLRKLPDTFFFHLLNELTCTVRLIVGTELRTRDVLQAVLCLPEECTHKEEWRNAT